MVRRYSNLIENKVSYGEINMEKMTSAMKTLLIMKRLSESPYRMSLSNIASELKMTKSGALKLLRALEDEAFVSRIPNSKLYQLGPTVLKLYYTYNDLVGIYEIAKPIMEAIAQVSEETCYICLKDAKDDQWKGFLAYKADSPHTIMFQGIMGHRLSIHAGAAGKLFAAYQPDSEIERMLKIEPLVKHTPYTIVDIDKIKEEYAKIRSQGYSIADNTMFLGYAGVSVPIFDPSDEVIASLSITGPKTRLDVEKMIHFLPLLQNYAQEISYRLVIR